MSQLRLTPLYERHLAAGARMSPFAGWQMPIQYAGILAEHRHTREHASLFDCCHMGQLRLSGANAAGDLDRLLPRRSSTQVAGSCRYNFLLSEDGTVIDDVIVYRLATEEFLMVVNAGTRQGDVEHLRGHLSASTAFADESEATAKLDLQGPTSGEVLASLGVPPAEQPGYFRCTHVEVTGIPCLLSRTGYTGERGFEFYCPAEAADDLWGALLGHPEVAPAGLGARDTLRLEMGYPLYGHELNRHTTPMEAGFEALLDLGREFMGSAALRRRPPQKRLAGLRFESRRAARAGAAVNRGDEAVGVVSSGSFAPSLGVAVALAYVPAKLAASGTPLTVVAGRTMLPAQVTELPFYRQGTVRD